MQYVVKCDVLELSIAEQILAITLLPYAATPQPSKGPFTKLADVSAGIDQAFANLVTLKAGEVPSQKSAVDAYITVSSADKYPSADSFLLLAPTDRAVYGTIAEAEKDFAATGKQLNALAKVVGKAGVGGVTLSAANIAAYNLDASVNSFPDATADAIVKKFGPTPTSAGGDGGDPAGGKPGGGDPQPGKGVPPVPNPQPDPDLCYWNE